MAWTSICTAIIGILGVLAALCFLGSRRAYPDPIAVDNPPHGVAIGIKEQLDRQDVGAFRTVFVHGMGTHMPDYANAWVADELAPKLGLCRIAAEPETVPIAISGVPPYAQPQLTLYRYAARDEVNNRDIDFRFAAITWSPLTTNYKLRLLDEEDQVYRAWFNKQVKTQLLDGALADAVPYVGKYREFLKTAVTAGLCRAFSANPATPCTWSDVDLRDTRLVFVSHSLGSRLLTDGLIDLIRHNAPAEQKLLPALNHGSSFFMFANQIPLLRLGDEDHPPPLLGQDTAVKPIGIRGLGQALQQSRLSRGEAGAEPVNVIAFSDPNDVLTYRVPKGVDYSTAGALRFINVRISNAATWFGLRESSIPAHTGYQLNTKVWDVVTGGLPPKGAA